MNAERCENETFQGLRCIVTRVDENALTGGGGYGAGGYGAPQGGYNQGNYYGGGYGQQGAYGQHGGYPQQVRMSDTDTLARMYSLEQISATNARGRSSLWGLSFWRVCETCLCLTFCRLSLTDG